MECGRVLVDLAACGRWFWGTWRRRLCSCGIALSEGGGGFEVHLVVLFRVDCILSWDVAPFVGPFLGRYRVVWAPFSFYGSMSESSRGLLRVVWGSDLARGGTTICGRWREYVVWCGSFKSAILWPRLRYILRGFLVMDEVQKLLFWDASSPLCWFNNKESLCTTHAVEHNYISSSSILGLQLHVSALYVGHLQVVTWPSE